MRMIRVHLHTEMSLIKPGFANVVKPGVVLMQACVMACVAFINEPYVPLT